MQFADLAGRRWPLALLHATMTCLLMSLGERMAKFLAERLPASRHSGCFALARAIGLRTFRPEIRTAAIARGREHNATTQPDHRPILLRANFICSALAAPRIILRSRGLVERVDLGKAITPCLSMMKTARSEIPGSVLPRAALHT